MCTIGALCPARIPSALSRLAAAASTRCTLCCSRTARCSCGVCRSRMRAIIVLPSELSIRPVWQFQCPSHQAAQIAAAAWWDGSTKSSSGLLPAAEEASPACPPAAGDGAPACARRAALAGHGALSAACRASGARRRSGLGSALCAQPPLGAAIQTGPGRQGGARYYLPPCAGTAPRTVPPLVQPCCSAPFLSPAPRPRPRCPQPCAWSLAALSAASQRCDVRSSSVMRWRPAALSGCGWVGLARHAPPGRAAIGGAPRGGHGRHRIVGQAALPQRLAEDRAYRRAN